MKYIKGSVCAMLFILAATAAGLAFLHICDAVYLMDVRHYGLAESTGLTEEQIMDNYNAVMEYLSPFSQGEFDLPDLPFSESGAYHFYETKNLYYRGAVGDYFDNLAHTGGGESQRFSQNLVGFDPYNTACGGWSGGNRFQQGLYPFPQGVFQ